MRKTALITGATAIGLAAAMSHRDVFAASGTDVDHGAAQSVQDLYDQACEQERKRRSVALTASTMLGFAGMPLLPPRPERTLTDFDRRQLDLAEEKRERKRKARAGK